MPNDTPDVGSSKPYPALELSQVLYWIADNCDDSAAMEKINKATFPFTSRYGNYKPKSPPQDHPGLSPLGADDLRLPDWVDA